MTVKGCSSCGHEELEPGFMVDRIPRPLSATWVSGSPEAGLLGLKLSNREQVDVLAYRCTRCRHLELFTA